MAEKVDEIKFLRSKSKKGISGWRPSGNPARDCYGHCRPLLVEHVKKLEALKQQWINKIEV